MISINRKNCTWKLNVKSKYWLTLHDQRYGIHFTYHRLVDLLLQGIDVTVWYPVHVKWCILEPLPWYLVSFIATYQWPHLLTWFNFNPSMDKFVTCPVKCEMKLLIISQTLTVHVEVWEWISNFISHFIKDVITYPCWNDLCSPFKQPHWTNRIMLLNLGMY